MKQTTVRRAIERRNPPERPYTEILSSTLNHFFHQLVDSFFPITSGAALNKILDFFFSQPPLGLLNLLRFDKAVKNTQTGNQTTGLLGVLTHCTIRAGVLITTNVP